MKRIYCTILIASLFSCEVLDQEPVSQITIENALETGEDAESALIGCYHQLANTLSQRYIQWGDARADNLAVGLASSANLIENTFNANSSFSDWSPLYNTINRCNIVINAVPEITDGLTEERKNQITGEARFIRALCYFYAVRLWGDVPLITHPTLSAEGLKVSRDPGENVFAQIEADLNDALEAVPVKYSSAIENKGRATKGGVLALQMHVYAWMAQREGGGAGYLNKAVSAYHDILELNQYSLLPEGSYGMLFSQENTEESIFELQYNYENQNTNGLAGLLLQIPFSRAARAAYRIDPKLLNAFEEGDLRKEAIVYYPDPGQIAQDPYTIKYAGKTQTPEGISLSDDNMIIFRLGGVMLLQAEVLNELNRKEEAIGLVNQIRNRAGLPPLDTGLSKEQTKQAILDEGFIELCYEGHRWFDLIRNGVALEVLDDIQSEDHLLWPIYTEELVKNPNLVQNSFY
ncbi:putative outer membrane starch-binding protein [Anseongella ginsenosidimutans]|uniref:Putative outer membrane starch-binding protein n=1 Tax=Anseongella ginsenosidimutans TaxID=496056 RepID=A0A4R3KN78_9SPHI|nr:RagB/SusD family nutrient uptake outer membrane protein [Anseongella ginsenosidimutans]QEC52369.1 RagB/SusD family nutrient uptake outer membrane protein [Anseongella ginsenosidimutans]TCS85889.1 putative outer membrane starch-binding protein [Anseongella ginsenosidimutans]